jgi:hypothetical protein
MRSLVNAILPSAELTLWNIAFFLIVAVVVIAKVSLAGVILLTLIWFLWGFQVVRLRPTGERA